jgi:hypothetical protein
MRVEGALTAVLEGLFKALAGRGALEEELRAGTETATRLLRQDPD